MKAAAPQAVQGETVVASYAYEITVTDAEGSPIQPAGGATATVAFQLDEADDLNLSVRVLHETADGPEELPAYAADGAVIAETTGFSKYTVEFYYNQKEYVLQGDSSIALSEILAAVGLTGEVTDVAVSNTDLFSAFNETGEWIITAHQAFDTTEWIAVTINGVAYDITVTDSQESVSVSYVEHKWNGSAVESETKTADAAPVPSDGNMTSGWYYLNSNVTKSGRIETITGDVNLILGDGFTLDVKGLYVPVGSTLTIYGQNPDSSLDNGKIYSHPSGGAAIGGYSGHDNGSIVIHGGNIVANGYDHCAGIGSNDGRTGGSITIYGGTVTAKGGSDGAGIGGGRNCNGGDITIYGGEITANGPTDSDTCENGAGIGGGNCGAGGNITIYGGTITTYSRDGAGIGGGDDGAGGNITIHGGSITSVKVNQGQGARIGGGCDDAPGTIVIDGGSVTTVGGSGAGIGGGKRNTTGGSVTISGGVINASGSYGIGAGENGADVAITLVYTDATKDTISIYASSYKGKVTLQNPFARYDGNDGNIYSFTIAAGSVSNNNVLRDGYLKVGGEPEDDSPVNYTEYSWNGAQLETTEKTSDGYTFVSRGLFKINPDGLTSGDYVVKEDTAIEEYFYIRKGCTVNLIVPAGVTLTCEQGIGCGYDKNGEYATLNIFGEGKIVANGKEYVAGIGGKDDEANGNITVHGTTIVATGGYHAAGIGGGEGGKDPDGTTSIRIYTGTVDATGGTDGAGIGGGDCQPGAHTYIYDGTVTAQGGKHGAGIGGGDEEGTLGIFIYGGTMIKATGGEHGAGIGAGEEGGNLRKAPEGGVNISGGTLDIIGGKYAAGIGAGYNEDMSGTVVISGSAKGNIEGGNKGTGIGAGYGYDESNGDMKGTVTINGTGGRLTVYGGKGGAGIGGGVGGNLEGAFHMTGGQVYVRGNGLGAGIGGGEEDAEGETNYGGKGGDCYLGGGTLTVYLPESDIGRAEAIGAGDHRRISGSVYIHKNNNKTGKYMRVASEKGSDQSTAKAGKRSSMCHCETSDKHTTYVYITECDHKERFTGESGFDYVFDENGHTGTCRYCGYTETHPHTFNDVSDICTVCGFNAGFSFVFFNSNGGSEVPTQMVVNGQKAIRPDDPDHEEGLTFKGWYEITNLNGDLAANPFDFENRVLDHKLVLLQAVWQHEHDFITFQPWNRADSLPTTAGDYYLTQDVTLTDTWTWSSGDVNLCLDGHTVSAAGQGKYGLHITNGQVNLFDREGGTITQAGTDAGTTPQTGTDDRAIIFVEGGSLHMHGGTVTGGAHTGVSVSKTGTFKVSGNVRVTGNGEQNVYLSEGVTLFVDETLDENAQIGVSMKAKAGCGVFTSGLSGKGGANNFFADEDECSISVHDDGEAYIEKLFNVTFDTDGGSDVDTQTVISGEKAIRPEEDPTKEGYTFTGWYQVTDADAGTLAETEFDFENTVITENITLKAVWEETQIVTINGVSGSFNDKIKLNYYFSFPQSVLADEKAYVTLTNERTGKGVKLLVYDAEFVEDKGYKFSLPLAAKEAGDAISAKVFNGEGSALAIIGKTSGNDYGENGVQYSLMQYFTWLKNEGTDDKEKAIGAAAKDYCSAAAIYFKYNSDGLALSSALDTVTADTLSSYVAGREGTLPGSVAVRGISAMLESDNTLRLYLGFQEVDPSNFTFTIDDEAAKLHQRSDGAYYLALNDGVWSNRLQDVHAYSISDGESTYTITASVLTYARSCLIKTDENVINLGKALYLYNQAAISAFGE